jgi:predicted ester cyclase
MGRLLVAAVGLLSLAGCHHPAVPERATPSPTQQTALRAFQDVFERALSRRDTAALLRSVAPELTLHVGGQEFTTSRESLWDLMRPIIEAFPDVQFRVDDVVADGDRAAARLTFTGTSRAAWRGVGPTGRRVSVTETFLCRLDGPQLRECWQEWDEVGLREQLTKP